MHLPYTAVFNVISVFCSPHTHTRFGFWSDRRYRLHREETEMAEDTQITGTLKDTAHFSPETLSLYTLIRFLLLFIASGINRDIIIDGVIVLSGLFFHT